MQHVWKLYINIIQWYVYGRQPKILYSSLNLWGFTTDTFMDIYIGVTHLNQVRPRLAQRLATNARNVSSSDSSKRSCKKGLRKSMDAVISRVIEILSKDGILGYCACFWIFPQKGSRKEQRYRDIEQFFLDTYSWQDLQYMCKYFTHSTHWLYWCLYTTRLCIYTVYILTNTMYTIMNTCYLDM